MEVRHDLFEIHGPQAPAPVRTGPDFVIAGAPKCGTTALFRNLSNHPSVFMPAIKEANYFCDDLKTHSSVISAEDYRALFPAATMEQITGEASALYLYSNVAIARLMAHNPGAKVVIMLRDPVDAAHALHAARWNRGHENIGKFEEAWRAQSTRLSGLGIPPRWPEPKTLQYGPIYRYAAQVRRLFALVPPSQRRVFIFEEFFAEPARHFRDLLEFLGIFPTAPGGFAVINPAIGPRSRRVEQLLRHPPDWLLQAYRPLRSVFRRLQLSPRRLAWRLNSAPRSKPELDPGFRTELRQYFADDIAELEQILGRSLWR